MTTNNDNNESTGEFILYQTEDGKTRIEVRFQDETVWLTQAQMSELFQTTKQNVSLHIQNIYEEHELERAGTVKDSLTVRQEGNRRVCPLLARAVQYDENRMPESPAHPTRRAPGMLLTGCLAETRRT
ncbi:MAG: hypothetical protein AB1810_07345 [Pseudomonadota bacterium]